LICLGRPVENVQAGVLPLNYSRLLDGERS
jgi:hypothetical protein